MFQMNILKLTSLLILIFLAINVRANCVGYDYEQQIPTVQTETPTVNIINDISVINPDDSIILLHMLPEL